MPVEQNNCAECKNDVRAVGITCGWGLASTCVCRVGKIVEVGPHPTADTLYVEHIDLGEDKPRQVGLCHARAFSPPHRAVILCMHCLSGL